MVSFPTNTSPPLIKKYHDACSRILEILGNTAVDFEAAVRNVAMFLTEMVDVLSAAKSVRQYHYPGDV
jgi:hypothetical protein